GTAADRRRRRAFPPARRAAAGRFRRAGGDRRARMRARQRRRGSHGAQGRSRLGPGRVTGRAMTATPLVELRRVCKHFGAGDTRVDALREVTLEVFPGEVVGLLGPSGSGKTTLLNVIGCILEPSSGFVRLDGEVVF